MSDLSDHKNSFFGSHKDKSCHQYQLLLLEHGSSFFLFFHMLAMHNGDFVLEDELHSSVYVQWCDFITQACMP